ncbi:cyclin-J isoform X1 [Microcebus murinus]|uniref:Cyclin-J n=2 Tax=Microcebus murinus TaxID=30608 RepID=A0A8C5VBJ3_MICMU|nr:cyclin-J isoform X1 [Microcebus murinus]XP_012622533.1 cyclin-J isoform X1 [Microcebus murinus]
MELEGQWWRGQLAADIHQALRYKELKLPSYKGQSPQLSLRRYFADLIAIVSNRFTLCPSARHLAVYLLDLFMDRYDISIQQLHLVALSCLLLASKFEEKEDSVPKLEQLNSLGCMTNMNLVLTKQNLLHMELLLLETFQWNLCLPTAAHFIEYYLSEAVHETDLHDGWPMICLEKTKLYMAKYADYFLEVSLQDYAFLNYAPSLVAAACVASSRIILRLSPTWPTRLHRLTAYSWDFLVQCIERLLIAHDNDVKEANKQRGQAGPQSAQLSVFQTASQPSRPVHFQQPQYLHQPHQTSLQYRHPTSEQPSCQQIVSTTHTSSYTLQTCPAGFQTSVQGLGQIQTGVGMSLAIPVEVKPCLSVSYNRSYQINEHYPCITPCFER